MRHIDSYNEQVLRLSAMPLGDEEKKRLLDRDPKKMSWSAALERDVIQGKKHDVTDGSVVVARYRPFFKQYLYFSRAFNERVYLIPKLFPAPEAVNRVILRVSEIHRWFGNYD